MSTPGGTGMAAHLDVAGQLAFLDSILQSSTEYSIVAHDLDGTIRAWNEGAHRLYGYEPAEVVGRQTAFILHDPDDVASGRAQQMLDTALAAGAWSGEVRRRRQNGTAFTASVTLTRRHDEAGQPAGFTMISRDITEEKRVEEELRRKNDQLQAHNLRVQEANRLKSEFLANMSHELRTPLNSIIGFAELMHGGRVGPVSDQHREYLGDILTSGRQLLQLINAVLDLSRVESGAVEFHPEPIDPREIAGEVCGMLRATAARHRITVDLAFDAAPPVVALDASKFRQVLYHYLSNALKFTDGGGRVTVRGVALPQDRFRLEVEDTGIGIRPEDVPRLFREFEQLDSSSSRKRSGSGLGLALARRIVEAQGGEVGVTSVPGEGSTFFAVLPCRQIGAGAGAP